MISHVFAHQILITLYPSFIVSISSSGCIHAMQKMFEGERLYLSESWTALMRRFATDWQIWILRWQVTSFTLANLLVQASDTWYFPVIFHQLRWCSHAFWCLCLFRVGMTSSRCFTRLLAYPGCKIAAGFSGRTDQCNWRKSAAVSLSQCMTDAVRWASKSSAGEWHLHALAMIWSNRAVLAMTR